MCRDRDLHLAIGVNERDSQRPGSLWNALAYVGPGGFLGKHRELMPTVHERLFHAVGAGDDLQVHDTPIGRIGGLICWENMMPLARYAIYRGGPQIYVAPTADDSESWLGSMRHIAYGEEGMLLHDCRLSAALKAKRTFDVTGHYGREDVLLPLLTGP